MKIRQPPEKRRAGALTPYQTAQLQRRLEIFHFVEKAGGGEAAIIAAANTFSMSERNIQRVLSRQDVRQAARKLLPWQLALNAEFEKIQRVFTSQEVAPELKLQISKALRGLRLVQQYLTESERAELGSDSLAIELASSRHRAKRKRRNPRPPSKVNDQNLAPK